MFYKKTLVLSSVDGGNEKAVMNIESDNGEISGSVRLYNFKDEPSGVLSIGILENDKVIKAGLNKVSNMKYSFRLNQPSLGAFACGLININKGEVLPLLHGSTDGSLSDDNALARVASEMDLSNQTMEQVKKVLDENNISLENQEEIDSQIEELCNGSCGDKCSECEYRKAFFSEGEPSDVKEENFFDGIKNQIDGIFSKYPEEDFLPSIIPNSKWVKVDNGDENEYYVLGLVYQDDVVKYICYGVPGIYSDVPPKDLSGLCQWLALDSNKPYEYGYWITYQDAQSGETIQAIFSEAN